MLVFLKPYLQHFTLHIIEIYWKLVKHTFYNLQTLNITCYHMYQSEIIKFCILSITSLWGSETQWVEPLTHNRSVLSLRPIKGSCCFLKQETLPSLLGTGWL